MSGIDIQIEQLFKKTDFERRNRWIKSQNSLNKIHNMMFIPYQGIALIDAQLVVEDININNGAPSGLHGDLGPHLTQSYLWVLGAYEIIRTLSQYADSEADIEITQFKEQIRVLKHKFEKLRVPLAKFEAPRRNPDGFSYAYPASHPKLGTCWNISNDEYISRRELSDEFLAIMEKLP